MAVIIMVMILAASQYAAEIQEKVADNLPKKVVGAVPIKDQLIRAKVSRREGKFE